MGLFKRAEQRRDTTWEQVETSLSEELASLEDHAVVVRSRSDGNRFLEFIWREGELRGECVGPAIYGGPVELPPQAQAHLADLGWEPPASGSEWYPNYSRFWRLPDTVSSSQEVTERTAVKPEVPAQFTEAAALTLATLQGPLNVVDSNDIEFEFIGP